MNKRKRYGAELKAKVALEALKGDLTLAQLATKHGVHQGQISSWRKQAVDGMAGVFQVNPKQVTPASKSILKSFMSRSTSWHWRMIAA
jgi:transposase